MNKPHSSAAVGVTLPADFNPRQDPPLDFPDRELGELTPEDYAELGFMAGLEVHQQLMTQRKLFCRCPAGRYVQEYDSVVLRHMRPTLSELGEYDGTALMEFKTRKEIIYRLERSTVCTYEIDDTPPFEVDEEAIRLALQISLMFNLNLVSELHVMRKQYLDGSIPTGFQRTMMMGLSGVVPFQVPELGISKELRIRQLSLEEDSCREVTDIGHRIIFRTDRLGMPLTEVVTEPDLLTPHELQAGARLIARATRLAARVRRGAGAARQDVNVSVAGGRRVEIKGVDNHRGLPLLVHIEAFRQLNLLRIRAELQRRGVTAEMLQIPPQGEPWEVSPLVIEVTAALKHSNFTPLRESLDKDERACVLCLPGFAGLLAHRTQPGVTFASEIADRVRVIACLQPSPFMIDSDSGDAGLRDSDWRNLRASLKAESGDTLVVLWGPARDLATAAREVFIRATDALQGIPAETRQAYRNGNTGFERILPGADRMYPDTDTPPLPIPEDWVETARLRLPEKPWEKEARFRQLGLEATEAARLVTTPWAALFEQLQPATAPGARRVFFAFEKQFPGHLRGGASGMPSAARLAPLLEAVDAGHLRPEVVDLGLERILKEPDVPTEEILTRFRPRPDDPARMQSLVAAVLENEDAPTGKPREVLLRWCMGQIMPELRGRIDPARVLQRLQEVLQPTLRS